MSFFSLFADSGSETKHLVFHSLSVPAKTQFYQNFLSFKKISTVDINEVKIVTDKKQRQYAAYVITVTTTDLQYKIERRYSEFLELYTQLQAHYKTMQFGEFPRKRLFSNLEPKVIHSRKRKLEEALHQAIGFLKILQQLCNYLPIYHFLEFLKLKELYDQNQLNLDYCAYDYIKDSIKTQQDSQLLDLLIKLNLEPIQLIRNFQELELFIITNKRDFSPEAIQILFVGDSKLKGLFDLCGVGENSEHVVCSMGLKVLNNILNYESNPRPEAFLKEFSKFHPFHLSKLNLKDHLTTHPAKNCKKHALALLQLYFNGQTASNRHYSKYLLDSEEAAKEYENWEYSKSFVSLKTESIEKDSCQWFNHASLSEDLRHSSATLPKKGKSPLLKRKSFFKEPKSSGFKPC